MTKEQILATIKDFRTMNPKYRTDERLAEMIFGEYKKGALKKIEELVTTFNNIRDNDKTPRYPYYGKGAKRKNAVGELPDSGRWLTPDEIAQNWLRALDKESDILLNVSEKAESED